ncbi:MAG: ABC transporter substrate-binding protein [Bacillota bacterium]
MKLRILAAVITALAMVALACPGYAQATDPKTFVYVTYGVPDTLDPTYAYDTASGEVIHQSYDNLIAFKDSSVDEMVPMLATQVPSVANGLMSKDGRAIKFPIRKGVKFHDGSVLIPEDVEYTFERAMLSDPAGGPVWMLLEPLVGVQTLRQLVAKVGGLDKIDDMKKIDPTLARKVYEVVGKAVEVEGDNVVFRLPAPYPPFLQILSKGGSWSAITSKKWLIAHGAWDGKRDTWVKWYDPPKEEMPLYDVAMGTGPFKLLKWDKSAGQVIFKRFDDYWQGPAKLETAFIKYIDEYNTRKLMLQTGEADAVRVDIPYLDQVKQIPGVVVLDKLPWIGNQALLFNLKIPVEGNEDIVFSGKLDGNGIPPDFFSDIHVRRAFNYAFDYDAMINQVLKGLSPKPHGPIPESLPYCNKDQKWYGHDVKKATEEFKAAFGGKLWEKGFKVTLLYNTGNETRKTACEILETNIESLNPKFKVEVGTLQWSTYLDKLRARALPVFFIGWHMDYPDAHNFVVPYMHSEGTYAGYCNMQELAKAKFDDLIAKGINATDPVERQKIYYELQKRAYEEAIQVFFSERYEVRVHRDWVKGFVYNPAFSAFYDFYTLWKEVK